MLTKLKILIFTSLGVVIFTGVAQAVSLEWVKRYAGSGAKIDVASAIATDSAGNVYVTGWSQGATSDYDFVTIKYSPTGIQRWVQRYNGPGNGSDKSFAMVVDASGNVYVTGESSGGTATRNDWATIKYSTNGQRLWVKRVSYPDNQTTCDTPKAIAVDNNGNCYVTGSHNTELDSCGFLTIKYDTNGNKLWEHQVESGFHYMSRAIDIVVHADGNVYVTGEDGDAELVGIRTYKFDIYGKVLWSQYYVLPAIHNGIYTFAYPAAIALDRTGNVYITGHAHDYNEGREFHDYLTIKYSTNGTQLWASRYNGTGNGDDSAEKIAIDQAGNVYVTGKSYGGAATGSDFVTVKYNTNGTQQWARRYSGPGAGGDEPTGLALDAAGNAYITGILSVGMTNSEDCATIKYNSQGDLVWSRRYNGPANRNDRAKAIAVDSKGNVFVTGHSFQPSTGYDFNTIKYVQ
jgi:uncharacterized delta-60 repeat protein